MDLNKMGKYIAKKRNEKKLTQQQLADLLNVSDKTISKWERGVNAPDISMLQVLAKSLNTTVVNILNGNDHQKDDNDSKTITDAISFYIRKFKNRFFKLSIIGILMVLIFFVGIYAYEKYNRFFIYNVYTEDEDYSVNGYLIYNSDTKMIMINDVKYNDIYVGTDKEIITKQIEVSLVCDDEVLFSNSYYSENSNINEIYYNDLLKNVKIDLNQSNNKEIKSLNNSNINNLILRIEYVDNNKKSKIQNIDLKVK